MEEVLHELGEVLPPLPLAEEDDDQKLDEADEVPGFWVVPCCHC